VRSLLPLAQQAQQLAHGTMTVAYAVRQSHPYDKRQCCYRLGQFAPTGCSKLRNRRSNEAQAREQRGRRPWLLDWACVRDASRSIPARRHTCLASASSAQRTKIGLRMLTANSPKWRNHSMAERDITGRRHPDVRSVTQEKKY